MTRDSDGNIIDLSGIKLKKWLVNVSKYNLTDDQTWVIIKGLNFARQATGGGIHCRYGTSMSVPADHQIRATTISGGWDYENCETAETEH